MKIALFLFLSLLVACGGKSSTPATKDQYIFETDLMIIDQDMKSDSDMAGMDMSTVDMGAIMDMATVIDHSVTDMGAVMDMGAMDMGAMDMGSVMDMTLTTDMASTK